MLSNAWELLRDSALFLLLGFLLAALLDALFSRLRLAKLLRGNGRRSVFWATLIGIPLPLCSCSVLPTALTLRRKGAGKGATVSFLISAPETGVTSIFLTYALIGPLMAIYRPIAACVTGLVAGLTQNAVERRFPQASPPAAAEGANQPSGCGADCCREPAALQSPDETAAGEAASPAFSDRPLRTALRHTFVNLFDDIVGWVLLGILAAAAIQTWIPPSTLTSVMGGQLQSMLLMLLIGVPLYVCADASTPIAAALIAGGVSPGAALVFLLAGPATNIGTIGVLARQFGRQAVAIYLASIVVVALAAGALVDLAAGGSARALTANLGEQSLLPEWLKTAGAVAFLAWGVFSVVRLRYLPRGAAWFRAVLKKLANRRSAFETETGAAAQIAVAVDGGLEKWTSQTCTKCSSSPLRQPSSPER